MKEDVEKKRFHIACNRVFEHVYQGDIKRVKEDRTWGAAELDTIVHPNSYFKRGWLLATGGKAGGAAESMGDKMEM